MCDLKETIVPQNDNKRYVTSLAGLWQPGKGKEPAISSKSGPTVATSPGSLLEPGQTSHEYRRTYTDHYRDRHHRRQYEVNRGDPPRGRSTTQHGHFDPDQVTATVEEGPGVVGFEGGSAHSSDEDNNDERALQAHAEAGPSSKPPESQAAEDLVRIQRRDGMSQIRRHHGGGCCVIF